MAFGPACRRSGDAKFSAAAGRRGASASPSNCRTSTPARKATFGFPRSHRLTRKADLELVIRKGKRFRTTHLDVRTLASPLAHPRVGLVVPKSGQTAVRRNRLKRQLRELVRLRMLRMLAPVDVVIRAARHTYDASFVVLSQEIDRVRAELPSAEGTE